MTLRWIAVTGSCAHAVDACRVMLGEERFVVVDTRPTFTFVLDAGRAFAVDSVDSPFERLCLRRLRACGVGPLAILDAGGNRSDHVLRVVLTPAQAPAVIRALAQALHDQRASWPRRRWWHWICGWGPW